MTLSSTGACGGTRSARAPCGVAQNVLDTACFCCRFARASQPKPAGQPQRRRAASRAAKSSHATRKPHLDHEALPAPPGNSICLQRVDAADASTQLELHAPALPADLREPRALFLLRGGGPVPPARACAKVLPPPRVDLKNQGQVWVHNASGPVALEKTLVYLRRYEIQYKVSNEWSSQTKREAANQFLLSLPNDAWLVYPDLDEFFAFPCEVLNIMDQGGLLSGQMVDRVAYDWHLNSLRPLPRAAKMNNRSSIDYQFPRSCRLTGGLLDTNVNKYTLVPAVDAAGKRLRYINAHSVACGTQRRSLRHVHAQKR